MKKLALILTATSIFSGGLAVGLMLEKPQHITVDHNQIVIEYSDYDIALQKIKEFEGFSAKPYLCPAGQKTIGYGAKFSSWGHNSITEQQADSLLRVSFNKHIRLAYRQTKLSGRKLLSVAMLMMNLKFTSWQKSILKQVVTSDDRERITAAWMSLCNAGGKKLKGLEKRRQWELNYFMSEK